MNMRALAWIERKTMLRAVLPLSLAAAASGCFTDAAARFAVDADSLRSVDSAGRLPGGEVALAITAALGGDMNAGRYTVRIPAEALGELAPHEAAPASSGAPEWNPARTTLERTDVTAGWPASNSGHANAASRIPIARLPRGSQFARTMLSELRPPRGSSEALFYQPAEVLLTGWSDAQLCFVAVNEEPVYSGTTYRVLVVARDPASAHMIWPILLMPITGVLDFVAGGLFVALFAGGNV